MYWKLNKTIRIKKSVSAYLRKEGINRIKWKHVIKNYIEVHQSPFEFVIFPIGSIMCSKRSNAYPVGSISTLCLLFPYAYTMPQTQLCDHRLDYLIPNAYMNSDISKKLGLSHESYYTWVRLH